MEILAEGKYARFVREGHWEYVERPHTNGIAVIVPVTAEGEIVLVEQYRIPVKTNVIELPAGLVGDIDSNEGSEIAAGRELLEETGYRCDKLEFICNGPLSPGLTGEVADFYLARPCIYENEGGGDETEEITVHVVKQEEAEDWLKRQEKAGKLIEPKVYAGLYFAGKA